MHGPGGDFVGLARTLYIRRMYGIFGREITKDIRLYMVCIYGSGQPCVFVVLQD